MGTPTPPSTPTFTVTLEEIGAYTQQYLANKSTSGQVNRDLIRELNDTFNLGLEIPITLGELSDAAEIVAALRHQLALAETLGVGELGATRDLRQLYSDPLFGGQVTGEIAPGFVDAIIAKNFGDYDALRAKLLTAESSLIEIANQYKGGDGSGQISAILRPPRPSIDQLPTAEEFTGEFNNAYAMYLGEVGQTIGPAGRAYLEETKGQVYSQYLNSLGNFARFGVSPFYLKEIDRLAQPGAGEGEGAAKGALTAALGTGVSEPTQISGTSASVSLQADQLGPGVPREFIALPRVDPLQFLRTTLPPDVLGLKAQGPTDRDVRQGQKERGGFVGQPTVVN
jgi:hypothetical protein